MAERAGRASRSMRLGAAVSLAVALAMVDPCRSFGSTPVPAPFWHKPQNIPQPQGMPTRKRVRACKYFTIEYLVVSSRHVLNEAGSLCRLDRTSPAPVDSASLSTFLDFSKKDRTYASEHDFRDIWVEKGQRCRSCTPRGLSNTGTGRAASAKVSSSRRTCRHMKHM